MPENPFLTVRSPDLMAIQRAGSQGLIGHQAAEGRGLRAQMGAAGVKAPRHLGQMLGVQESARRNATADLGARLSEGQFRANLQAQYRQVLKATRDIEKEADRWNFYSTILGTGANIAGAIPMGGGAAPGGGVAQGMSVPMPGGGMGIPASPYRTHGFGFGGGGSYGIGSATMGR